MRTKLFLALFGVVFSLCAVASSTSNVTFFDTGKDFSTSVFVGSDASMPMDGSTIIAIQPKYEASGKLVVPKSLASAFALMREAVPRWYLVALSDSSGDTDCDVQINRRSATDVLTLWFIKHYEMTKISSPIAVEFQRLGLPDDRELVYSALVSGFCEYVRTNSTEAGLRTVASYAREKPLFRYKAWSK
jgi:hypothetical protein